MGENISPGSVRRPAEGFGNESISAFSMVGGHEADYAMGYRLPQNLGRFLRMRYPPLSLVR